jgi:hypothetical protein
MDRVSKLRISIAVLILTVAGVLLCDSFSGRAQTADPYALQEKVAVNTALVDQILVHDAETNARFKAEDAAIGDIGSRISHIEGGFGAVVALLGLYVGLPFLPNRWKRKNP